MKEIERTLGSERQEYVDVPLPIDIEAAYLDRYSYASVKQHEIELLLYSLKEDVESIKKRNATKVCIRVSHLYLHYIRNTIKLYHNKPSEGNAYICMTLLLHVC